MSKILYLEDEHYLGRIVKESLSSRSYDIRLITDGANFMKHFEMFQPDICVLDIMVPHVDGFTIAKEIRTLDKHIPIIFLSAKNQTEDVIEGFQSGGNDYLKKPFSMEELIVRIENLLHIQAHKTALGTDGIFPIGDYQFSHLKFSLEHPKEQIKLSHRENELILLFAQNINQKLDRRLILKKLWGDDSLYNSRNLDVYIRKLRLHFKHDPAIEIKTLRGVGYFFAVSTQ